MLTASQFGAASLISQGISSIIGAFAAKDAAKYNNAIARSKANIARINADMYRRQAEASLRASEKSIVAQTMKAGQVKSKQRVALAANGISLGVGSAAEIQASTDILKKIDTDQLQANANNQAWGYRQQAASIEGQALIEAANQQDPSDVFGATLLGGASQLMNNYAYMDYKGWFDKKAGGSGQ